MSHQHNPATEVARNIAVHDRIARKYEKVHGEIFNPVEQSRLRHVLKRAMAEIRTSRKPVQALDVGCGSGNLTQHLLELGCEVMAADVSTGFLQLVEERFSGSSLKLHRLNGRDLSEFADRSFDLIATYSVLHHIPDYLAACAEMARVCRKGGIIVIDHEASPNVWLQDPLLQQFRREALRFDWRKYLTPSNYLHRLRRVFDPRYSNEGDIHVWPDDHIGWGAITETMRQNGCELIIVEDYLLYRRLYRRAVYDRYKDRCVDTRVTAFRRNN